MVITIVFTYIYTSLSFIFNSSFTAKPGLLERSSAKIREWGNNGKLSDSETVLSHKTNIAFIIGDFNLSSMRLVKLFWCRSFI